MKNLLFATATVAGVILSGFLFNKKLNKDIKTSEDHEHDTVSELIETSRTLNVFSQRFTNYVYGYKNEAIVNGYFISVLYNWNVINDLELFDMTDKYFGLRKYQKEIDDKFGEASSINVAKAIVDNLALKALSDKSNYNNYQSIEDASIWEKVIPYLENKLVLVTDYDQIFSVLKCLLSFYAQCDYEYYTTVIDELKDLLEQDNYKFNRLFNSSSFDLLKEHKEQIEGLIDEITSKYEKL